MDQQRHTPRCTAGHHLGLCLALALGLVLGTQMAMAKECHRETPLPADVRLVAPGPQVPEATRGSPGCGAARGTPPTGSAIRWSSRRCSPTAWPGSSIAMALPWPWTSPCRGSPRHGQDCRRCTPLSLTATGPP